MSRRKTALFAVQVALTAYAGVGLTLQGFAERRFLPLSMGIASLLLLVCVLLGAAQEIRQVQRQRRAAQRDLAEPGLVHEATERL